MRLTVLEVATVCAAHFDITVEEVREDNRTLPVMDYRRVIYALAKEYTGSSLSHMGRQLYRDHGTIHRALKKYEQVKLDRPVVAALENGARGAIEDYQRKSGVAPIRFPGGGFRSLRPFPDIFSGEVEESYDANAI